MPAVANWAHLDDSLLDGARVGLWGAAETRTLRRDVEVRPPDLGQVNRDAVAVRTTATGSTGGAAGRSRGS
jgi:hypothetical protein